MINMTFEHKLHNLKVLVQDTKDLGGLMQTISQPSINCPT